MININHTKSFTRIYIEALFIVALNWKQHKCPLSGELEVQIKVKTIDSTFNDIDGSQNTWWMREDW